MTSSAFCPALGCVTVEERESLVLLSRSLRESRSGAARSSRSTSAALGRGFGTRREACSRGPFSVRSRSLDRCARSSTENRRATGGHPATRTGFQARAGAAATFAARDTPMPSRNAIHTTARARRPTCRAGFSSPTVAKSNSPSTGRGHSAALAASPRPGGQTPSGERRRHTQPPTQQPGHNHAAPTSQGQPRENRPYRAPRRPSSRLTALATTSPQNLDPSRNYQLTGPAGGLSIFVEPPGWFEQDTQSRPHTSSLATRSTLPPMTVRTCWNP